MDNKPIKYVTPVGEAYYPHIRITESYQDKDSGKYSCSVKLTKEEARDLAVKLNKEWKQYVSDNPNNEYKVTANLGYKVNGDYVIVKAKTKATITTKAGDSFESSVPVFDAQCNLVDKSKDVGNGSRIRMCFTVRPYYIDSETYGLSLMLKAVQVETFKEFQNAASYGFEAFGTVVDTFDASPF